MVPGSVLFNLWELWTLAPGLGVGWEHFLF